MGSPVHASGDRHAECTHRVRRPREHPGVRFGDPRVQPSFVLRPDRDGPRDRQDRSQCSRARQEGGVRRPDRRAPDEGLGRYPGRSWHRLRRATRRRHRRRRGRRAADDRSRGNDSARTGVLRSGAEGSVGCCTHRSSDRGSGDSDRAVGHREGVASKFPASQDVADRPAAGDRPGRSAGEARSIAAPTPTPRRS